MVQAQKQTHKSMKQNKNPEINPHTYGQEARIHNGEKIVSSINGARKTSCVKRREITTFFFQYTDSLSYFNTNHTLLRIMHSRPGSDSQKC